MLFIFDIGGVVTTNIKVVPAIAKQLKISEKQFFEFCQPVISVEEEKLIKTKHNFVFETKLPKGRTEDAKDGHSIGLIGSLCRGDISGEDFWTIFNIRTGIEIETDYWQLFFKPKSEITVIELINELRKNHRVVCGTNTMAAHYDVHLQRGDYLCFDKAYASHLLRTIKPDPKFWELILLAEGYEPKDAVFFDDTQENVVAASNIGINSFLFTTFENAKKDIGKLQALK